MKHKPVAYKGRVLLVTEYFLPHWTGISQSFFYLGKNLQKQGHKVLVLTTQYEKNLPVQEEIKALRVIREPYQLRISRTHYSFTILGRFLSLLPDYDTVILNSPNSNILFLSLLTTLLGKKLIIYHQGDLKLPRQTGNLILHRLMEALFDILTIPSMFLADAVSTFTKDYARHSRVMRYSLYKFRPYIPDITPSSEKPSAKFKKKVDAMKKNAVLIGLAGRFVEEKGYDILVQAIPFVVKAYPKAMFMFAGKKMLDYEPFYEKHRGLVEANATHLSFMGLLSGGDLAYFYKALEVFVISSRSECLALTQIEAIHSQVPIVVTDTPGARMIVKESGFGEVVKMEDPEDLARGIIEVIKNRKTIDKNHKKAIEFLKKYENFRLD